MLLLLFATQLRAQPLALPALIQQTLATAAPARQALAEGISLAPGPIFSAQQGFRHCIRLNCGHPWDARSEAAMARLGELLKAF